MDYIIREATGEDEQALTALFLEYGAELQQLGLQYELNPEGIPGVVAGRIKSRMFLAAVAERDGEPIGFVYCSMARVPGEYLCRGGSMTGYLNDIYVTPGNRGQGIAGALAAQAEQWLLANGIIALELQVVTDNRGAAAFWERRSMRPAGTLYYKELDKSGGN